MNFHKKQRLVANSPEDTLSFSESLAADLKPGDVVALIGELGVGKTLFAKGIARGLGYRGEVTSPSFVHVHLYRGKLPVYHVDLYRERSALDVLSLGLEEYIDGEGVTLVEWADRFPELLPKVCWQVLISTLKDNIMGRMIEIIPPLAT